ncbi:MAG: DUF881 domain-containing protein [Actinomycetaceae bacterium]|nr:DUF881 domain-containing protein [Actinomycetaceae bacterium]
MSRTPASGAPSTPHRSRMDIHHQPRRRPGIVAILTRLTVFVAAGLLFATSASLKTVDQGRYEDNLHALVARKQNEVQAAENDNSDLRDQVNTLLDAISEQDDSPVSQPSHISRYTGPGLTVTLTDAPIPDPIPPDLSADVFVIHQQDIEAVLNALWTGGAEVVGIQGTQVNLTTEVQCVGNVININGKLFSPPYEISAIGSTDMMKTALKQDEQIQIIQGYVARFGLGFKVKTSENIVIDRTEASPDFSYAKAKHNE